MRLALALCLLVACAGVEKPAAVARSEWIQRFATHDGVRIEYLVRDGAGPGLPVVLVPGMTNPARDFANNTALVAALGSRKLVAISLRGRGGSDAPATGWTPAHHHADIRAVIEAEQLGRYHLIAHSMGVAYSIGFALDRRAGEIASYVAGDYFPAIIQHTEEWAKMSEEHNDPRESDPRLPRLILREQGTASYEDRIAALGFPILVILGTESMDRDVEGRWAKAPRHRVMWIEHGHDVFVHAPAIAAVRMHLAAADAP